VTGPRPSTAFLALSLLAVSIVFAHLGEGHLANFDDCYYAEKAKEMVRDGDWITPHYDGAVILDNPPFFLWLMAGSFLALGVRDYAAILPSAISGVLCVLVLHHLARRLGFGSFASGAASVVLLTTQYFLKYSRHAMFDVFLTLLFLLSMLAYRRGVEGRKGSWVVLGVLGGLGVLTKNVLGLFPMAVAFLHLLATGRARLLVRFLAAPFAAAVIVAPWYLAQLGLHRAQFIEEHFRWLILERGLSAAYGERGWSNYVGYFRDLATYYWPWLPVAAWGVAIAARRARARGPIARPPSEAGDPTLWTGADTAKLILLWLLVVIGVMSAGREKKLWYIMTAFPALALAAALALESWIPKGKPRRLAAIATAVTLLILAVGLNFGPGRRAMRAPDLYRIARIASATAPAGSRVVNYGGAYWSIQNLFLYYSGRGLTKPTSDADSVRAALDDGAFALVPTPRAGEIAAPPRYRVAAVSGSWSLLRGGPEAPVVIPANDADR